MTLINTKDAAKLADIKPSTLRDLWRNPHTKTPPPTPTQIDGRTLLWDADAIREWAQTRDRNTGKAPTP